MVEKLLTVSIAAYNVEKFLGNTLESLCIGESYREKLEVIIVNDGSLDNTKSVAEYYEKSYPQLFKVINKKNGGYGSTINVALKEAKGKYFRLLDGDDWVETVELEKLLKMLAQIESDIILSDMCIIYEKAGKSIHKYGMKDQCDHDYINKKFSDVIDKCNLAMHMITFKTELLKKMKFKVDENRFYTDMEYIIFPLPYIKTMTYIRANVYQYRISGDGQSISVAGMRRNVGDAEYILDRLLEYYDSLLISDEKVKGLIEKQIAIMSKRTIKCLLLKKISLNNRQEILKLNQILLINYPNIYKKSNSGLVKILRINVKIMYWICALMIRFNIGNRI